MLNRTEKLLLYGGNLWYLGEGMLGPLFAVFTQRVGGNVLDISWAWSIYLVVMGLLMVVVGNLCDRGFSKEKMMVSGYALNTIFTFCYLFVSTPAGLFIVQAGLGVAAAMAGPTWYALYAKHEDRKHDGEVWGLQTGESHFLTGIAILTGGAIVNYFSFSALFWIMGSIQMVATIYQAQILRA